MMLVHIISGRQQHFREAYYENNILKHKFLVFSFWIEGNYLVLF